MNQGMRHLARTLLTSAFGVALILAATRSLPAQAPTPQATFAQSVADLQKTPTDTALREKIIKLALEMKPAPAVPEEAKAVMASGTALFTAAKSPDDFRKAAWEFLKVTRVAPWLAEGYYNLASAQEKAGFPSEAAESLRLYLLAAPKAPDAKAVSAHRHWLQQQLLANPRKTPTNDAKAVTAHLSALQQEGLMLFLADLQKTPSDDALREKIIRLACGMTPPPAIPEEARRHYVMATTLFRAAKKVEDFGGSIDEFKGALLIAPWWPEANQNLGLALEAAQRYDEAIAALKLYLAANPGEKDARAVQDEIYKIEAQKQLATRSKAEEAESAAKKAAEEARAAAEARSRDEWILGRWTRTGKGSCPRFDMYNDFGADTVEFTKSGDIIEAYWCPPNSSAADRRKPIGLRVLVSDKGLEWQRSHWDQFEQVLHPGQWVPFSPNVSPDRRRITYSYPGYWVEDRKQDRTYDYVLTKD